MTVTNYMTERRAEEAFLEQGYSKAEILSSTIPTVTWGSLDVHCDKGANQNQNHSLHVTAVLGSFKPRRSVSPYPHLSWITAVVS